MVLKQRANFYNNISTEMIPSQKPMMLKDAMEFEQVRGRGRAAPLPLDLHPYPTKARGRCAPPCCACSAVMYNNNEFFKPLE